ncbi:chromosome segregation protein SMC [Rubrobacter calidifluminis]|uniref:chromosome segregation protein SMC n=1 Tax=Rubrobacter calidifluminis TaxID=1392640 RepID=UPI0023624DF6|nr:chromosome segregation protein SMC [Rubrobacter calidifluminis]
MLKDIYIKGFKTFVRPVRMPLERGVTAIIGPNGSGKSNITDAVLFALGEQSPSLLRASSMSDVIFSGSETLKPAAVAEVTLVFDNSSGEISLPYEEVSITRRISRDGRNVYRINGSSARLVDVRAVAGEAGVGRHSIVRQGAVGSIVTGGASAARDALEEAAGLGVYRRRRLAAERRLGQASDQLEKSRQMEAELASQLRRIEREAEAAREYRELEARYRSLSLAHLYRLASRDLERRRRELRRAEARVHELSKRESELRARRERLSEDLVTIEEELSRQDAIFGAIEGGQERLRRLSVRLERASVRLEGLGRGVSRPEAVLQKRLEEVAKVLDRARRSVEAFEAERARRLEAADRVGKELRAARERVEALSGEREKISLRLERLRARLEQMSDDASSGHVPDHLLERLERLPDDLRRTKDPTELQNRISGLQRRVSGHRRDLEDLLTAARERQGALAAIRGSAESTLRRLRAGREGAGTSIRLREVIRARPGFESAVDAALRELGDGVLADDLGAGLRLVTGPERVAVRLDASPVEEEDALPGLPLWECIEVTDPRYSEPIRRILCGIYVIENPSGIELSNGHVFVTPEGLRLTRASVARGGSGFFEREGRIRREEKRLSDLERGPAATLDEIRGGLARASDVLRAVSRACSELDTLCKRLLEARELLASRAERLAASERRSRERAREHRQRAGAFAREISTEEERLAAVARELHEAEKEASGAASARADARENLRVTEHELADGRRVLRSLERRHERLLHAVRRSSAAAPTPDAGALENLTRRSLEVCTSLSERLSEMKEALRRTREEAGERRRRLGRLQEDLASSAAKLAGEIAEARGERERLADELHRAERGAEAAREELHSEWGATLEEARRNAEDLGPDTEQERRELARRLKNFGDVNLLAISQQEQLRERHRFLVSQREDAEAAATDIKRIIQKIDREIERRFLSTFERVREIFEGMVPCMMSGGQGRLELSEDGVEMAVRIGKRGWKPLQVLSGGERSLLALAFLFSIFLGGTRESGWFCMLDEAEAALDDLSLARFLSVVDSYRAKGQILLVTHQKRTMASADVLYGVSVDGTGATAVVSKRLKGE